MLCISTSYRLKNHVHKKINRKLFLGQFPCNESTYCYDSSFIPCLKFVVICHIYFNISHHILFICKSS